MADMVARGRHVGNRKLTAEDREAIASRLAAGEYYRVIAADYGVSRPTISRIANAVTPPAARDLVACVAEALGGAA